MEILGGKMLKQLEHKEKDELGNEEVIFKKEYYIRDNGSRGIKTIAVAKTITQHNQLAMTDINNIVRRHSTDDVFSRCVFDSNDDGIIDVASIPDFTEAQAKIAEAKSQYERLPVNVKKFFGNDYERMVNYTNQAFNGDKEKIDQLVKLGLMQIRETKNEPKPDTDVSKGKDNA